MFSLALAELVDKVAAVNFPPSQLARQAKWSDAYAL